MYNKKNFEELPFESEVGIKSCASGSVIGPSILTAAPCCRMVARYIL